MVGNGASLTGSFSFSSFQMLIIFVHFIEHRHIGVRGTYVRHPANFCSIRSVRTMSYEFFAKVLLVCFRRLCGLILSVYETFVKYAENGLFKH